MRSRHLDFQAINAAIGLRMEAILLRLFPNGCRRGREFVMGSIDGEKGASLRVCLAGQKSGVWKDFATGAKGGDIISLVAASRGISQGDAARILADMLGVR